MKTGKNVTTRQMFAMVFITLLANLLHAPFTGESPAAFSLAWVLYTLLGTLLFVLTACVFASGNQKAKAVFGAGLCVMLVMSAGFSAAECVSFIDKTGFTAVPKSIGVVVFVIVCGYVLFTGVEPVARFAFVALALSVIWGVVFVASAVSSFEIQRLVCADYSGFVAQLVQLAAQLPVFAAMGIYSAFYAPQKGKKSFAGGAAAAAFCCAMFMSVARGCLGGAFSLSDYPLYLTVVLALSKINAVRSIALFWGVCSVLKIAMLLFAAGRVAQEYIKAGERNSFKYFLCMAAAGFALLAGGNEKLSLAAALVAGLVFGCVCGLCAPSKLLQTTSGKTRQGERQER